MSESFNYYENIRTNGRELLERLRARKSIENPAEIAIVVAHPDDESIAFGSLIPRMPKCLIVHVTDGAPANTNEWKGSETREQYAEIRAREMDIVLDLAGHTGERVALGSIDQEAALRLVQNARSLAELLEKKGIRIAMTHSYEGGHPDHDASAFIVHAAKELMEKRGLNLSIIEAPLYRIVGEKLVSQNFIPESGIETIELPLSKEEAFRKSILYDSHRSQEDVFNQGLEFFNMSTEKEFLREAPKYNFAKLPNNGHLSHIFADSGLSEKWQMLIKQALKELGL